MIQFWGQFCILKAADLRMLVFGDISAFATKPVVPPPPHRPSRDLASVLLGSLEPEGLTTTGPKGLRALEPWSLGASEP